MITGGLSDLQTKGIGISFVAGGCIIGVRWCCLVFQRLHFICDGEELYSSRSRSTRLVVETRIKHNSRQTARFEPEQCLGYCEEDDA